MKPSPKRPQNELKTPQKYSCIKMVRAKSSLMGNPTIAKIFPSQGFPAGTWFITNEAFACVSRKAISREMVCRSKSQLSHQQRQQLE